jgi:hypothetical protein
MISHFGSTYPFKLNLKSKMAARYTIKTQYLTLFSDLCSNWPYHTFAIKKSLKICFYIHTVNCRFYVTDGNIMYLTDASRFLISCVIQHYAPVVGWGGWRNRCIMLIMTLDPSWRQTLRLPPPGIEPGSPASQAGTLPKELSRHLIPELRIRDLYPKSRILILSHPGSWIQNSNKREG